MVVLCYASSRKRIHWPASLNQAEANQSPTPGSLVLFPRSLLPSPGPQGVTQKACWGPAGGGLESIIRWELGPPLCQDSQGKRAGPTPKGP